MAAGGSQEKTVFWRTEARVNETERMIEGATERTTGFEIDDSLLHIDDR